MAGADRMTIEEVVKQVLLDEHADVIREAVKALAGEMMELEVSELIGAERGERRPEDRATHRNGYRARRWDTRAGEVELQIPRSARATTSRASSSRAGAPSRRCWRSCSKPMSVASRRGGSISWSRVSGCGSPSRRSAASAAAADVFTERFHSQQWMSAPRRGCHGRTAGARSRRARSVDPRSVRRDSSRGLAAGTSGLTPCLRPR